MEIQNEDLRHTQQELEASRTKYYELYDFAPVGYLVFDQQGVIKEANLTGANLLGVQRRFLINTPFLVFVMPKSRDEFYTHLHKVFKTGKKERCELQLQRKDHGQLEVLLESITRQDDEPNVGRCLSAVSDISERKRTEQALRESEERLSVILKSTMDAIITIDDAHRIVLFNEAAEKVFRCSAAEMIGQPIHKYLCKNLQRLITNYMKVPSGRKKSKQYMLSPKGLTARRADGEQFPFEATISHVEVSRQSLYTIILRDINDHKRAKAELKKLRLEKIYLREEIDSEYNFGEIVGASNAMKKVFKNIEKVAATDSIVLLTGETGTGKELIARAIHNLSSWERNVLIKVNCGALPANLVESELFGHERGAFTGATEKRKGRFELANGGTIFLDEVGELPLDTQAKLLRVLEQQEFERVGGTQTLKVNVRVIAATNRNLGEAVKQGAFRSALFYRLNIFPISIPPLRERMDDIPLLTNHFIKKFSSRLGKRIESINPKAMEKLMNYDWPGNVRELANILERAVILCEDNVLKPEHISISAQHSATKVELSTLEDAEREHILKALEKTGGLVGGPKGAAELLGLKRTTLLTKMKKLGIG